MKITDIEQLSKGLCKLYLDGNYHCTVYYETVVSEGYRIGDIVQQEDIDDLVYKSDLKRGYERALYLIEYRPHSVKELYDKLKKNYPEQVCNYIVNKLINAGLLNDKEYAGMLVRNMVNFKKYGTGRIKSELMRKGIDKYIIEDVLCEETEEDTEYNNLVDIIRKKYITKLSYGKELERTVNALVRKGYKFSDIRAAVRELSDTEILED